MATWTELSEESFRRFRSEGARVYPYLRLDPFRESTPLVRTHLGFARVLSVVMEGELERVDVMLEDDWRRFRNTAASPNKIRPRARRLAPRQILSPIEPPPNWQTAYESDEYHEF